MAAWCAMGDPGPRPESGFPEAVTSARCRHIPAACGGVDKLSSAGFTICGWTPRGYRKRAGSGRAREISKSRLSRGAHIRHGAALAALAAIRAG